MHKDDKTEFEVSKQKREEAGRKKQKTITNGNKSRMKWKNFTGILKKKWESGTG